MAEDTPELQLCPVCGTPCNDTCSLQCCDKCYRSLNSSNLFQVSTDATVEPIVSSSALEEASIAIANASPDSGGCTISRRKKAVNNYYRSLNTWIDDMREINEAQDHELIPDDENEANGCIRWATYVSFSINVCLLVSKAIALSSSSGSYTIISSLCDSALDLIAGTIIMVTAATSKFTQEDLNRYPVGKSRVSTVGLLVFSVLMACCAIYIIIQCVMSLLNHEIPSKNTTLALILIGVTIGVKLTMAIVYYLLGHPITKALAEDHRNDVLTNTLGILMYWGSDHLAWWMDSFGGIVLSCFVLVSWSMNALENARMLLGRSAPDDVIRQLTYVAAHHHPLILTVEQVIGFQVGPGYFCELHIVVPGHVPLEIAHWIGESLQLKVERMPDIERCWVHVDCETHNINEHVLFMRATGKLDGKKRLNDEAGGQCPTDDACEPNPVLV